MKLSVVTTLFRSEDTILEFDQLIRKYACQISENFEIIYVNDGSPDSSLKLARECGSEFSKTKVIDLTRNFGHHRALMRGIAEASGDFIFIIDSDLEENPSLLLKYWEEIKSESGIDLIEGRIIQRKAGYLVNFFGHTYWKIIQFLSSGLIQPNLITARLFTSKFRSLLLKHEETEIFIAGLFANIGLSKKQIFVEKSKNSPSSYSFRKRLKLALVGVTSFSDMPLRATLFLGSIFLFLSFLGLFIITLMSLTGLITVPGWASLMSVIILMNSIILFSLGIVGIYIANIFNEVKRRPLHLDSEVYLYD